MYNYKYYQYSISLFTVESVGKDKVMLHERYYPKYLNDEGMSIASNLRNYHIDKLNRYNEYEKDRYIICFANSVKIKRCHHRLSLTTTICINGICIKISYNNGIIHGLFDKTVDKLTPISQL